MIGTVLYIILLLVILSGCTTKIDWNEHKKFAYQLQGYNFEDLKNSPFTLFVVDVSLAGNSHTRIEELK